jgi:uncharacterized protein YegP (UPF0339 family)
MHFEILKNAKGEYYWRLVAANGEIICWSEGYTSYSNAVNSVNLVKKFGPIAPIK